MKLDIGCGKNKAEGFFGVDQYAMAGVDAVADLGGLWRFAKTEATTLVELQVPPELARVVGEVRWSLPDESVEEARCSHFLEHLTGVQRVQFFNELYRVMKPGAKALFIMPHWASNRAYGDFTHQWPPVSEMLFYYLKREWRKTQAPHTDIEWNPQGYTCDFEVTWGYSMHPEIQVRNAEQQQFALKFYKEAAQDTIATLTKL